MTILLRSTSPSSMASRRLSTLLPPLPRLSDPSFSGRVSTSRVSRCFGMPAKLGPSLYPTKNSNYLLLLSRQVVPLLSSWVLVVLSSVCCLSFSRFVEDLVGDDYAI
uniref:Uncharacterized protein n=1 Tax=Opuntia streptacantha TaxID=393608 RepID=A0A7C8ZLU7_OPUST